MVASAPASRSIRTHALRCFTDDSESLNAYAGLASTEYTISAVDTESVEVVSYIPAVGAVDVALDSTVQLTFNKAVVAGAGHIVITGQSTGDVHEIAIDDASQVDIVGSTVTVTPANALEPGLLGQSYRVEIEIGVIRGADGIVFLGLYGPMYQFEAIDSSAPTLASSTPANGAVDVPKSSDLVFVMNEPVTVDGTSSGKLTLTPSSGAANIVVDRSAFGVAGDGVTVTVTLADLVPTQTVETYTVTMDAGILVDTATTPNAFAGIGGSELVFAIADTTAPAVSSTDPSHMDTGVTSTGTTITVTFNEAIAVGVGNIMLSGVGTGTGTESVSRVIAVTDTTQVGVSGADLVITPLGGLDSVSLP